MPLDRAHFDIMTGSDRALQLEVVGLFRSQVDTLRAALGEASLWRDAVHTLKGSARGIGLGELAAACEAAEAAAPESRVAALARVDAALAAALAALDQFVADAA